VSPLDLARRDEPTPAILDENEEEVEPPGIELLDNTVPTLIATRGSQLDGEVIGRAMPAARGLDLDPNEPATHIRDQVVVRTVEEREGDAGP
jgi:hypothetical protein